MGRGDLVRVVESAYGLMPDDAAWLREIVTAACPLDLGTGVYAFTCEVGDGDRKIGVMHGTGSTTDPAEGRTSLEAMPEQIFRRIFGPGPPVGLASEKLSDLHPQVQQAIKAIWAASGVADHIGVKGWNPSGETVILGFAVSHPARLPPRTISTLSRIACHLSAGLRLRRLLQGTKPQPDDAETEAVLTSSGRVLHASGAGAEQHARRSLRQAVVTMQRARGPLRKADPIQAVGIWHGLVRGRWTLIDHEESDGKHFVLARRNDPAIPDPQTLGLRERQVIAFVAVGHSNKLIAYELGLTPSTVAGHIRSALDKLKLQSRREIIALFGSGWPKPGGDLRA